MKFFRRLFETFAGIFWLIGALFVLCMFLRAFAPLSPLITAIVFLFLTLPTFARGLTALMSIGGIILYALSWPITKELGTFPGLIVWILGVFIWFAAVYLSFCDHLTVRPVAKK